MQSYILYALAGSFIGLASNQRHLVGLGWLSSGVLIAMLYIESIAI